MSRTGTTAENKVSLCSSRPFVPMSTRTALLPTWQVVTVEVQSPARSRIGRGCRPCQTTTILRPVAPPTPPTTLLLIVPLAHTPRDAFPREPTTAAGSGARLIKYLWGCKVLAGRFSCGFSFGPARAIQFRWAHVLVADSGPRSSRASATWRNWSVALLQAPTWRHITLASRTARPNDACVFGAD